MFTLSLVFIYVASQSLISCFYSALFSSSFNCTTLPFCIIFKNDVCCDGALRSPPLWNCRNAVAFNIFNNYHSDICIRFFLNIFTKFINLFFFCCLSFMMLLWQFLYVFLWFFIYIQHLVMNKMIHFSHFYDLILLFFYILKNSYGLFGFVCFEIMKLIILFISIIIRIINIISFWNGKCLEN